MKDSCNNLGFLSKLIGTSFVARGTADKGCQLSVLHPLVQVESRVHIEGEVGTSGEGEVEDLTLVCQRLAEGAV